MLIRSAAEITGPWLAEVLGRPGLALRDVAPIGTGQMSQNHRATFSDGGTVVIKLASEDRTSRATGVGMGAYAREVTFYRELAGPGSPACHLAVYDDAEGWFTLVLEDVADAVQGDQIAGCSPDDARTALAALAKVHGPVLGDAHVGSQAWLNQASPLDQALFGMLLPGFLDRYGDRVAPEHAEVCERFAAVVDAWAADRRPPLGLVHGDYRLDNLLFGPDGCTIVDWQTVSWGPALLDAAYFLGSSLTVADRRAHEHDLLRTYLDGVGLGWEEGWTEYRRQAFYGILINVVASMVVVRTDRGDDMFMACLARSAQQVLDLDSLSLLPDAGAAPVALRPDPADEGRHEPGPEPLWNESWYFDAVSDDGTLGVYVRAGHLPNQGFVLHTSAVVGPGRPAIMLIEERPLDGDDGLTCEAPLERFTVRVHGTGEAHEDESAPLRGEPGTPVDVGFDLTWETDGVPYQWRVATRYEIPCRVSGTVTVDGETIAFSGVGQRDHSWGARDWWANDWMWNALHLEDGTHTHAVMVSEVPGMAIGYAQRAGTVTEFKQGTLTEELAPNGLISAATITTDDLVCEIEPVAFGALRLDAPDGRVSHFPRAMCRVATADGRTGVGWIEFNRNQR